MLPSLIALARHAEAVELADQVHHEFSMLFPPEHGHVLSASLDLAQAQLGRGDVAAADKLALQALNASRADESSRYQLSALNLLTDIAILRGDLQRAGSLMDRLDRLASEQSTPQSAANGASYLNTRASYLAFTGRFQDAISAARKALALLQERLQPGHPLIIDESMRLALTLSQCGQHEEAVELASRALQQTYSHVESTPMNRALMAGFAARILLDAGYPERAIESLSTHRKLLVSELGSGNYQTLAAECVLGSAMVRGGRGDRNSEPVRAALRGLERQLGSASPLTVACSRWGDPATSRQVPPG
jgi:tetratricopeptide (TPR) repeat protein